MKSKIFLLLLFFLFNTSFTKNINNKIPADKMLSKPIQLSENLQINKIIQFIIQYYGKSFIYYNELISGNYEIEKTNKNEQNRIRLVFLNKNNKNKYSKSTDKNKLDFQNYKNI